MGVRGVDLSGQRFEKLHVINKVKTEDNIQREEIEELQGAIAELAEMIAELNITVASLTESDNEEEGE